MSEKLKDAIPIFCNASIPRQILEEFVTLSHGVPDVEDVESLAVLVDTQDVSQITSYISVPISDNLPMPFLDWSAEDIIEWAAQHLDRQRDGIVPYELVILDQQTLKDKTCLLVTTKDGELSRNPGNPARIMVRSDFKSALATLNVKVQFCGGDGHFETTASDGVIRHYDD
ncbi:hypothetical protein AA0115_g10775 [Alternaria tenuissima]|uniref:Uncharacterized protein n=1 Tax=Alternaria tenuissima TaxID=119927 RepID=A0AB37W4F8_9PLEO|nr:hypothetical protein AA0115_g10775 [Alternaria tenuissima]